MQAAVRWGFGREAAICSLVTGGCHVPIFCSTSTLSPIPLFPPHATDFPHQPFVYVYLFSALEVREEKSNPSSAWDSCIGKDRRCLDPNATASVLHDPGWDGAWEEDPTARVGCPLGFRHP